MKPETAQKLTEELAKITNSAIALDQTTWTHKRESEFHNTLGYTIFIHAEIKHYHFKTEKEVINFVRIKKLLHKKF